jgi:hypothetical protein
MIESAPVVKPVERQACQDQLPRGRVRDSPVQPAGITHRCPGVARYPAVRTVGAFLHPVGRNHEVVASGYFKSKRASCPKKASRCVPAGSAGRPHPILPPTANDQGSRALDTSGRGFDSCSRRVARVQALSAMRGIFGAIENAPMTLGCQVRRLRVHRSSRSRAAPRRWTRALLLCRLPASGWSRWSVETPAGAQAAHATHDDERLGGIARTCIRPVMLRSRET